MVIDAAVPPRTVTWLTSISLADVPGGTVRISEAEPPPFVSLADERHTTPRMLPAAVRLPKASSAALSRCVNWPSAVSEPNPDRLAAPGWIWPPSDPSALRLPKAANAMSARTISAASVVSEPNAARAVSERCVICASVVKEPKAASAADPWMSSGGDGARGATTLRMRCEGRGGARNTWPATSLLPLGPGDAGVQRRGVVRRDRQIERQRAAGRHDDPLLRDGQVQIPIQDIECVADNHVARRAFRAVVDRRRGARGRLEGIVTDRREGRTRARRRAPRQAHLERAACHGAHAGPGAQDLERRVAGRVQLHQRRRAADGCRVKSCCIDWHISHPVMRQALNSAVRDSDRFFFSNRRLQLCGDAAPVHRRRPRRRRHGLESIPAILRKESTIGTHSLEAVNRSEEHTSD